MSYSMGKGVRQMKRLLHAINTHTDVDKVFTTLENSIMKFFKASVNTV